MSQEAELQCGAFDFCAIRSAMSLHAGRTTEDALTHRQNMSELATLPRNVPEKSYRSCTVRCVLTLNEAHAHHAALASENAEHLKNDLMRANTLRSD